MDITTIVGLIAGFTLIIKNARKGPQDEEEQTPLGSGERFAELKRKLARRKGIKDPAALAAAIGRRKYGKQKMAKLSAKGRREG